jgi:ABC-2 type transport system ATP-binding protein
MSDMIVTAGLTKQFGPILAVDKLDLAVRKGEVLGFLGPNGAGKSTTMKMITGFLAPTGGTAKVCGFDVATDPLAVKSRIGYLPEGAPLYSDMTAAGFLKFIAEARGVAPAERKKKIDRAIELTQLEGVLYQAIDTLSKGFKRRVGLAQAILHDPDVLVLDEPTDGLDPNQKQQVRRLIQEMAASGGKSIVLSTHILEEVEAVCSRAVIIARGRVVADGTPQSLMARSKYHNAVSLAVRPPAGTKIFEELARLPGVAGVEDGGTTGEGDSAVVRCVIFSNGGRVIDEAVAKHVKQRGWGVERLQVVSGRLDDVFRQITAA